MVLVGDFAQLPPVGGQPMFKRTNKPGFSVYRNFDRCVVLQTVERQRGPAQERFRAALQRLSSGDIRDADCDMWGTRCPTKHGNGMAPEWQQATRLYTTNAAVDEFNIAALRKLNTPVAIIEAEHNNATAKKATKQEASGLRRRVFLADGCRVMLTSNLWPETGLVNGTRGVVREIIYPERSTPTALPIAVMVEFDGYTGPGFSTDPKAPKLVPIVPTQMSWTKGHTPCSRTQLPLRTACALIIHKSQGGNV